MEIFERILYLRKDYLKMTRKEFADKLGTNESVIVNIELNRLKRPDQKEPIYKLICKTFDISEKWLLNGIEPMERETDIDFGKICESIGTTDPKAREAIMKYFELSEDDKKLWWKFAERFIK